MKIFETIISNPIYILLFGSGGLLAIAISVFSIITTRKSKKNINIRNSKKTSITENNIKNQSIIVKNCKKTDIHNNIM